MRGFTAVQFSVKHTKGNSMSAMKELVESICALYDGGYSPTKIARLLDMSEDEIDYTLQKYYRPTNESTTH